MTDICLVIPPSPFLLDERVFPSLGILKVAAELETAGKTVEVIDLSGVANFDEAIEHHLGQTSSRTFGLTMTTPQAPAATRVARTIRRIRPDAVVICGGPHPTLINAAVKLEQKQGRVGRAHRALDKLRETFDVIVAGDGEDAIFTALGSPSGTLVDADEQGSSLFMTSARYDASPVPARHLIDLGSYRYTVDGAKATSLIAQLGCPFACSFCGGRASPMLRRVRTRTTKNIVDELEFLHTQHGYTGFMFYDDELNVNKGMVELMDAITDLQDRLGVGFNLRGFLKAELITSEQLVAMRRAGFRWFLTGFEAAHPRILENIKKKATLEDNTRAVEMAHAHDLKVKALMSIGHAGESEETVRAVEDWLVRMAPEDFDVTIITTYPGCPYYDEAVETAPGIWTFTAKKSGDRLHSFEVDYSEVADYYKGSPDGGYQAYVYTDHLSSQQLVTIRDEVERSVRTKLGIPFNQSAVAVRYEHSMGQSGPLPPNILKTSQPRGIIRKSLPVIV